MGRGDRMDMAAGAHDIARRPVRLNPAPGTDGDGFVDIGRAFAAPGLLRRDGRRGEGLKGRIPLAPLDQGILDGHLLQVAAKLRLQRP